MLFARVVHHVGIKFDPGLSLEFAMQRRSRGAATATREPATVPGNLRGRKDSVPPLLASSRRGERTLVPMRPVRTRLCSLPVQQSPARVPSGESRSNANLPRSRAGRPSLRGRRLARGRSAAEIFSSVRSWFLGLMFLGQFQPESRNKVARP